LKRFLRFTLTSITFISILGLSSRVMTFPKEVVSPDKTLYQQGLEYLEKLQYIKARLAFTSLINDYPDSDLAPLSYFEMANSYYSEGGTENLLSAEEQFGNFIIFFPKHPKALDAQMMIFATNMKLIEAPARDRQYTLKVERKMKNFIEKFPDSKNVPIIKQWLNRVQEILIKTKPIDIQDDQLKNNRAY
jgi:outer membrane protein assembly factor BamD